MVTPGLQEAAAGGGVVSERVEQDLVLPLAWQQTAGQRLGARQAPEELGCHRHGWMCTAGTNTGSSLLTHMAAVEEPKADVIAAHHTSGDDA